MNTTSAASLLASVLLAAAALPAGAVQQFPRHRNPLGFSLSLPQGWQVDTSVRNVIVVRDGSRSSWVAVQPFLLRAPAAAESWLGQALGQLSWLLPQARIVRSARRPEGPNTLVASVRFLLDGKPAQASLLCVIHGRTGMLYGIGAEVGQFAARRPLLVQVLQSFRFETPASSPAGGAGGGARLAYVPWQDPRENAFTVEIPRGWSATGGLFRFSTVDVRGAMEIRSPDGQIRLIAGDPAVPPHTIPNQMLAMTGFPEGSWYSPGYNQRFLVRRYMPGVQFAVEYARSKLGAGCPDLRLLETRELPRESQQLSSLYRGFPGVAEMQVQAGETAFTDASANARNGSCTTAVTLSGSTSQGVPRQAASEGSRRDASAQTTGLAMTTPGGFTPTCTRPSGGSVVRRGRAPAAPMRRA
mgnify:CR=1 FL=1